MQTGQEPCAVCGGQRDFCSRCGGRSGVALTGPAALRGARWAERVVRQLVLRWPVRWPRSPKAMSRAGRQIEDLARGNRELYGFLVSRCLEAAAERYSELVDYLAGRRLELPAGPVEAKDEDTPL